MRRHGINAVKRRLLVDCTVALLQRDFMMAQEVRNLREHPVLLVLLKPGDSLLLDSCA